MTPNNSLESSSSAPVVITRSGQLRGTGKSSELSQMPSFVIETVGGDHSNEEIDLREYVSRILRNKLLIVLITLLLMIAPTYFILNLPSVYQAETKIQVDAENDLTNRVKGSATTFDNRAYFNTQLKLLKNSGLLVNIIKANDLDSDKAFLHPEFISPDALPRTARSSVENAKKDSAFEDIGAAFAAERLNPLVEAIQESLDVQPILQSKQAVKDTRLISVRFRHPNPKYSKLIANAISEELVSRNLKKKTEANTNEQEYLSNNIAELRTQIRQSENQILQFGRRHQLPSVDGTQNTVVERLGGLNRQLLEAENERKIAEAKYKASLAPGAPEALAETDGGDVSGTDAKLDDLKRRRAELLVEVTERHPDVLAIDKQITVLENAVSRKRKQASSKFKTNLKVNLNQAIAREKSIRRSYDQQWQRMLKQNGAAINYRMVQQELETNRKLLDEMQRREKESEMLSAKEPNNIRVIEYAVKPAEPVHQNRYAFLGLAFFLSFSIGTAAALLKEFVSSLKDHGEEADPNIPASLSLPKSPTKENRNSQLVRYSTPSRPIEDFRSDALPNGVETESDEELSGLADAIKRELTVLQLSPELENSKTLLVTSGRGDGQTKTSLKIAETLAASGASVLIIDSNFYAPKIHTVFGLSNDRGIGELLSANYYKKTMRELILEVSENLYFLSAGPLPSESSERLGSSRMRELLESLEAIHDYIIIDAPPVLFHADSSVMATNVDGVLLVVGESGDSIDELDQIRVFLKRAGASISGVVMRDGTGTKPVPKAEDD